jgi:hypothetical protein
MKSRISLFIGVILVVLSGCSAEVPDTSAEKVCAEAEDQMKTTGTANGKMLLNCEAMAVGESNALVFELADYVEWVDRILVDWSKKQALFDIPLGLIVYSFAKSDVTPSSFDSVIVAFRDQSQTVYEINPKDLTDILEAQTEEVWRALLASLPDKVQFTTR